MLQILVFGAGIAILFYALRWVRRECDRVETSMRRINLRMRRARHAGASLVFGAASRFSRPAK
jgi:uncharacterized membrane protein